SNSSILPLLIVVSPTHILFLVLSYTGYFGVLFAGVLNSEIFTSKSFSFGLTSKSYDATRLSAFSLFCTPSTLTVQCPGSPKSVFATNVPVDVWFASSAIDPISWSTGVSLNFTECISIGSLLESKNAILNLLLPVEKAIIENAILL